MNYSHYTTSLPSKFLIYIICHPNFAIAVQLVFFKKKYLNLRHNSQSINNENPSAKVVQKYNFSVKVVLKP